MLQIGNLSAERTIHPSNGIEWKRFVFFRGTARRGDLSTAVTGYGDYPLCPLGISWKALNNDVMDVHVSKRQTERREI